MNYNPQNLTKSGFSEIGGNYYNNMDNTGINSVLNINSGISKNKPGINISDELNSKNSGNMNSNIKVEYIPPQYNFKFFRPNDSGIMKRIKRSQIPFKVSKDTKILLEYKKDNPNNLNGPNFGAQNLIEIIEDDDNNNNVNKIFNYNEYKNNFNGNNLIMKKRLSENDIKMREEILRSKKRGIINLNNKEKDLIRIRKINTIKIQPTIDDYKMDEEVKNIDSITSTYNLMKREHTYLRVTYGEYVGKRHPYVLPIFLAEILDKIYFIKILIFLKKFDLFSMNLALYVFYHILLLSLLCGFFTIKVIRKIWNESDFPTLNFYLLYGFLAHIIVWIIYKIFALFIDNQDRIRALVKLNNEVINNNSSRMKFDDINFNREIITNQEEMINDKYLELIRKIKVQTFIFYILIILITGLCFCYLLPFFAVYTGTKGKVIKAYYISIIEIIIIKFVYGLSLAALRIASEINEVKCLYNFVYFLDKYFS